MWKWLAGTAFAAAVIGCVLIVVACVSASIFGGWDDDEGKGE